MHQHGSYEAVLVQMKKKIFCSDFLCSTPDKKEQRQGLKSVSINFQ